MHRRLIVFVFVAAFAVVLPAQVRAAESTRIITERDSRWYHSLQAVGLADSRMGNDTADMTGLTRYELALIVGRAIERIRAGAWDDAAKPAQKIDALEAMLKLVAEFRPELQRLNVSDKNTVALVRAELRKLRPNDPSETKGQETTASSAPSPAVASRRSGRTFDLEDQPSKFHSLASLQLSATPSGSPSSVRLSAALSMAPHGGADAKRGLDFGILGGRDVDNTGYGFMRSAARIPVGDSLSLSSSMARAYGILTPDNSMAWRTSATYAPGPFSLRAALGQSSSDPLVNLLAGLPSDTLSAPGKSFGGDVRYRGPLGVVLGGKIEGIQYADMDNLLGRYSTIVGLEHPGNKLSLSLDFARSAFFYDSATAVYSAQFGLRYAVSSSVGLNVFYHLAQEDDRTLSLRDSRFQNFMAGQVSVRW